MAEAPKRGYLGPRPVDGFDPAIDRMSDRIDELEAEIERLRAAGDALALSIETFVPGVLAHISIKQAFSDWQKARRG